MRAYHRETNRRIIRLQNEKTVTRPNYIQEETKLVQLFIAHGREVRRKKVQKMYFLYLNREVYSLIAVWGRLPIGYQT